MVVQHIKNIFIYSTPTCSYCKILKSYLDEKGIKYTAVDLAKEADRVSEMVELSGQYGVPVMVVNKGEPDQVVIVGFNKSMVNETLGIS